MRRHALLATLALLAAGCPEQPGPCDQPGSCPDDPPLPNPPSGISTEVVATGGTATYTIYGYDPSAGELAARVLGGAIEIESVGATTITVRALEPGTGTIGLSVGGGPEASVSVTAQDVAAASLSPTKPEVATLGAWAFFAGDDRGVTLTLMSTNAWPVIDESAQVFTDAAMRPQAWNLFALDHLTAGTVPVTVIAGKGQELAVPIAVVDVATTVELEGAATPTVGVNQTVITCFRARVGATTVIGAPWTFAAEGAAAVTDGGGSPNCAAVVGLEPGPATLTAQAGGQALAVPLAVVAP